MTDVLLAHSFFLENDAKQLAKMRPYPPLATLYAASALRREGYDVALFDAMLACGMEEFEAALSRHRPRFVALYDDNFNFLSKMCLAHARRSGCRMAELARAAGATVFAAGADATDRPEDYFEHGVQYVLAGEPDHTLVELLAAVSGRDDRPANEVPGLILPADGPDEPTVHTAARLPERDPDVFGLPAWDLVDAERYRRAWTEAHGYFSLNLVTTRGCPFHCNWCAKPIWGQRYAMRSPAAVAAEMALVKELLAPDHIWFADDIFGLQPRWVAELADEIERRDAAIPFMIQTRVDLMTERAVTGLARAGCVEAWLGVESGSQAVLDAMDKGVRVDQVAPTRARLTAAGIRTGYFLQFGYPGETLEDVMATVALVRETLPEAIGVSVSYPLPGTKFHRRVRAELRDQTHWEESADLAMMFEGTFTTDFYRRLHELLHRDLELRLARRDGTAAAAEIAALDDDWRLLTLTADLHRSSSPTHLPENASPAAPDLSRRWN